MRCFAMSEQRAYLLSYQPKGKAVIRDFFNAYGEVQALLLHPPETRHASFGMRIAAIPQLRNGEYWELDGQELFSARVRRLRVYVDGSVIFRASADGSFLCWPKDRAVGIVNPVVVADSIVSFCRLVRDLLLLMPIRPDAGRFGVEIRDAGNSEPQLMMYPGKLRKDLDLLVLGPRDMNSVGEISPRHETPAQTVDLLAATPDAAYAGADAAAYDVVKSFYEIFGFNDAAIPYVERTGARPFVNVSAFAG
jgi:hypothetical protein